MCLDKSKAWAVVPLQMTQGADLAISSSEHVVAIIQHDPDVQREEDGEIDGYSVVWHTDQIETARILAGVPLLLQLLTHTSKDAANPLQAMAVEIENHIKQTPVPHLECNVVV